MRVSVWFVSTLCVLFYNLYAEAITPENVGCFQISTVLAATAVKVTSPIVSPVGSKITPPPSSVPLTLETDGIWRDTSDSVFAKQISDHALAGQMVDEIPVYTWNTWGFQSKGGFSASNTESLTQYQTGRLKEQVGILFQISVIHQNLLYVYKK